MNPTLRPGERHEAVERLAQALSERGISISREAAACRVYGLELQAAVLDFQVKHGLTPDDVVGPATWRALEQVDDEPTERPVIRLEGLSRFAAAILRVAERELGVAEDPMGSNRGARVDQYVLGILGDGAYLFGEPWCGRFARWCVDSAAEQLGMASPVRDWGDLASAIKWIEAGKKRGMLSRLPTVGAIGCIVAGKHGHVVLVADVLGDGTLTTIEGNSSNRVRSRARKVAEFAGFVRAG